MLSVGFVWVAESDGSWKAHGRKRPHYSARTPELNNQEYLHLRLGVGVHMSSHEWQFPFTLRFHCSSVQDFSSCSAPVPGVPQLSCSELLRDAPPPWSGFPLGAVSDAICLCKCSAESFSQGLKHFVSLFGATFFKIILINKKKINVYFRSFFLPVIGSLSLASCSHEEKK